MMQNISSNHRRLILGVKFDLIDYRAAFERILQWRAKGERAHVTITNPHSVLLCHRDKEMHRATSGAAMTLPDGVGIILAAHLLGYENCGRVTGPTLMLEVCDRGRRCGLRHFFCGGAEGVAEKLAANLSRKFTGLQVAGTYCPPFRELTEEEDNAIVERIDAAEADVLWVGLGAPKQELWMAGHLGRINVPVMIGVGAAFDFHSGNVRWAPAWIRKTGLEWAYRLAKEPRRMWRRNLDNPLFLAKILWQQVMTLVGRDPYIDFDVPIQTWK
jgi:N-acetylglucosaminyldiphosphoundecaprenol N-acetyl-beta-D-mannosaminyltransferase